MAGASTEIPGSTPGTTSMKLFRHKIRRTREGALVAFVAMLVGIGVAAGYYAYLAILEGK